MKTTMLATMLIFGALLTGVMGDEPATAPATTAEMQRRIEKLEQELAEIREILAPLRRRQDAARRQQELRDRATTRREAEKPTLTGAEQNEIDALFKTAARQWNKPEGEASLAALAEKFPRSDHLAAAYLQIGQMRRDTEGERLLRLAAEQHADAYNLVGVQVGPMARFILGMRLWNSGRRDEANTLFRELRERFPEAVGARGNLLVESIPTADQTPATTADDAPGKPAPENE